MTNSSEAVQDYLRKHSIGEVKSSSPHKEMIQVKATDTVESVLGVFRKHNILSTPVIKESYKEDECPFLGIISVLDLLIASIFQPVFDKYTSEETIAAATEEELAACFETKEDVFLKPVKEVLGSSEESKKLHMFEAKDPLNKLVDAFSAGVHRVLIKSTDDGKSTYKYISQTDVVRSLRSIALDSGLELGGILSKTATELKLGHTGVVSVTSRSRAVLGFKKMFSSGKQLSALPVLDPDTNGLVDTLSASDFRGVQKETLRLLLLPVVSFLSLSRAKPRQKITVHQNVVASPDEKFAAVIERIVNSGVHRLWIINSDETPIGVISLTDIIRQFSSY